MPADIAHQSAPLPKPEFRRCDEQVNDEGAFVSVAVLPPATGCCESESDRTRYRDYEIPVSPMSPVGEYFG